MLSVVLDVLVLIRLIFFTGKKTVLHISVLLDEIVGWEVIGWRNIIMVFFAGAYLNLSWLDYILWILGGGGNILSKDYYLLLNKRQDAVEVFIV